MQAISFQVIWLTAVLAGNRGLPVVFTLLLMHFIFSPTRMQDIKILPLAFIGIAVDISLTLIGVFQFNELPLWLIALWFAFVLNFSHSLKFLHKIKFIGLMALGAVGGCYAYIASWKLGAAELPLGLFPSSAILLVVWAIMFPLLIRADGILRGYRNEESC